VKKYQFLVVGLGVFGTNVAKILSQKGAEVLVIDNDEKKIQEISPFVTQAIVADATDEKTLRSIGAGDIDIAIVAIGENMEASILTTLLLRELGVKQILVKNINPLHAKIAAKVGADRIVYPEVEVAHKVAESFLSPNIFEVIKLSQEYNVSEVGVLKKFWGKNLKELDIRAKYGVNVIAIKRKAPFVTDSGESDFKEEVNIAPGPEEELNEGDRIIVIGKENDIEKLK